MPWPIPKPRKVDDHTHEHLVIGDRIFGDDPMIIEGPGVQIQINEKGKYIITATARGGNDASGYMGEYDQTKSYTAGQQFIISAALTISGTTLPKGIYGVRPASNTTDTPGFGPWAGQLPANPATSGIDMDKLFFIPANGLPTFAADPNDKLYAELIAELC